MADGLGEIVNDGVSVVLPVSVQLGEAVVLGLCVGDGDTLCEGVIVPVKLDDCVPVAVPVSEGLDDDDAVAL